MVRAVLDAGLNKAAVARLYRTTPKTVAKWVTRFLAEGADGLRDRSSKPPGYSRRRRKYFPLRSGFASTKTLERDAFRGNRHLLLFICFDA